MQEVLTISQVEYLGSFKLKLEFSNTESRIVDLEQHLDGAIYQALKEQKFFAKVSLNQDLGTITWANGADFAPEFLYQIGVSS